ncbi:hypothetical protein ACKVMT_11115 [Halobacteriales archaeon Cl-PHB]
MPAEEADESALAHLAQFDHVTFLLALVLANLVVGSRWLTGGAATLLLASLAYDVWEFYG